MIVQIENFCFGSRRYGSVSRNGSSTMTFPSRLTLYVRLIDMLAELAALPACTKSSSQSKNISSSMLRLSSLLSISPSFFSSGTSNPLTSSSSSSTLASLISSFMFCLPRPRSSFYPALNRGVSSFNFPSSGMSSLTSSPAKVFRDPRTGLMVCPGFKKSPSRG